MGQWQIPDTLAERWSYKQGKGVLLGVFRDRLLGRDDDRHVVTIAGSRSGKSRTVLVPNLWLYQGPVVVIDPKGELARETRAKREKIGPVYVLDPFNEDGDTKSHNPIKELQASRTLGADAAQIAEALIIAPERGDLHWTDAARNLFTGLILQAATRGGIHASIPLIRQQLTNETTLQELLIEMAVNDALDGTIKNIALSTLGKYENDPAGNRTPSPELRSILSTAREQTRPLDDVRSALTRHDFNLKDLARDPPATVYLVLPATRLATHSRWLRLFIYQLLATMERNPIPYGRLPLWLILEEFAALGTLRTVETAAGYMAGMGVKLWAVLQDLTQLQTHYSKSWETFLGNAGVIQAFANVDRTTTKYLSDLLGQTLVTESQSHFVSDSQRRQGDTGARDNLHSVPLMSPSELAFYFARETGRQLVMVPGELPAFFKRLETDK